MCIGGEPGGFAQRLLSATCWGPAAGAQGGLPPQVFQLAWVAVAQPVGIVVEITSWNFYG